MKLHNCPAHGPEECLMLEKSHGHGCRQALPLIFTGPVVQKEIVVL